MQRVDKAVELNVLGSGTTYGAQGKNGPQVEGLIRQFFAKVAPASTTPGAAYSGDLTLQIQKPNGAVQIVTRANIKGLNHTTYAYAGYEYINPAAARSNSNRISESPPEPIRNGEENPAPTSGGKFMDFMISESQKLGIEVEMALAILKKESRGLAFCPNGKMLARFEPHSFIKHVKRKYGEEKAKTIPWYGCKKSSCDEWKNLGFKHVSKCSGNWNQEYLKNMKAAIDWCAQNGVDDEYVYKCASYGAPQVMGFNHNKLGYTSAKTMFEAFAASEMAQLKGMFNFFAGRGMVDDMRNKDFEKCSVKYNGDVDYADGFEKYYNEYKSGGLPPNREMIAHGAAGATLAKELAAANPLEATPGGTAGAASCPAVSTVGVATGNAAGTVQMGGTQVAGDYPANANGLFPAIVPKIRSDKSLTPLYGPQAKTVRIPFQGKMINVNVLVKKVFEMVDAEIEALKKTDPAVAAYKFKSIGGYNPRCKKNPASKAAGLHPKRDFPHCSKGGKSFGISTHSWGVTVDVNPAQNPYKKPLVTDIPKAIVGAFKRYGFKWGGDWSTPDSMHFQFMGHPSDLGVSVPAKPAAPTEAPAATPEPTPTPAGPGE